MSKRYYLRRHHLAATEIYPRIRSRQPLLGKLRRREYRKYHRRSPYDLRHTRHYYRLRPFIFIAIQRGDDSGPVTFLTNAVVNNATFRIMERRFPILSPARTLSATIPQGSNFIKDFGDFRVFSYLFENFQYRQRSLVYVFCRFTLVRYVTT